jgi:hypothetical protein
MNGVAQKWDFEYTPTALAGNPEYQASAFQWLHTGNIRRLEDPYTGPFGWTDSDNPRGSGCAIIGTPTINTQRHWIWKQKGIQLTPVRTAEETPPLVYANGGVENDGGAFPFADNARLVGFGNTQWLGNQLKTGTPQQVQFSAAGPPQQLLDPLEVSITIGGEMSPAEFSWTLNTVPKGRLAVPQPAIVPLGDTGVSVVFPQGQYTEGDTYALRTMWSNAQCACTVTLEFESADAMMAAGTCSVNGVCFVPKGGTSQNVVCSVSVERACTVTLVWHFDVFVTNYEYANAAGNIG